MKFQFLRFPVFAVSLLSHFLCLAVDLLCRQRFFFPCVFSRPALTEASFNGAVESMRHKVRRRCGGMGRRRLEKRVPRRGNGCDDGVVFFPPLPLIPFSSTQTTTTNTQNPFFRLKKEMKAFMESPPPFIPEIYVDDNDITSELVVFSFV